MRLSVQSRTRSPPDESHWHWFFYRGNEKRTARSIEDEERKRIPLSCLFLPESKVRFVHSPELRGWRGDCRSGTSSPMACSWGTSCRATRRSLEPAVSLSALVASALAQPCKGCTRCNGCDSSGASSPVGSCLPLACSVQKGTSILSS